MIELQGIRKRFGAQQVLDGIDLSIAAGRVTALVGPNSAGKTTLIKTILGLIRADAGSIAIDGTPVDAAGRYRAGIGYMPQIARFPENLSGADLLEMMRDLRPDCEVYDEELIETLALRPQLDKPLRVLSGGTRQKVNAALAFLFQPRLLILDEPTAGLDPTASSVLKDRILADREKGRTFIVASHVMSELEEVADDVVFLIEGRVHFAGPVRDLKLVTRQLSLERAIAHVLNAKRKAAA